MSMISLVLLGGDFHLRSTWKTYCDEFRIALQLIQDYLPDSTMKEMSIGTIDSYETSKPMTHHERKYCNVGLSLYQLNASLGIRDHLARDTFLQHIYQQGTSLPPTIPSSETI
jgi:hypothetical protein